MQTIEQYVRQLKRIAAEEPHSKECTILNIAKIKYPGLMTLNIDTQHKAIREAERIHDDHQWYMAHLDRIMKP